MSHPDPDVIQTSPSVPGNPAASHGSGSLGSRIRGEVLEFSSALRSLFEQTSGGATRPSDLARALNIDVPLASRLFRVAHALDASEAMDYLPTLNQARRVIEAAMGLAPGAAADRALAALRRFEGLAGELGEDQRDFESIVSMHLPSGVRRVELAQRRAAYRANTHLWGMTTDCFFNMCVFVPSSEPGVFDAALTVGYLGARLLRPGGDFRVRVSSENIPSRVEGTGSEGPGGPPGQAMLLREFSTVTDAMLTRVEQPGSGGLSEVVLGGSLPTDAQTVVTRHFLRAAARTSEADSCCIEYLASSPTARLHMDIAVPVGATIPSSVRALAHANRHDPRLGYDRIPRDRVPLYETPQAFTNEVRMPPAMGVPRLTEMFDSCIAWLGLEGRRFDIYRCDVDCPMLHSVTCLRVGFGDQA